jgi:hypothetical protein
MSPHAPKPAAGDGRPRENCTSAYGYASLLHQSPSDAKQAVLPLDAIHIGKRLRPDMGDIAALAANIAALGLTDKTQAGVRTGERRS